MVRKLRCPRIGEYSIAEGMTKVDFNLIVFELEAAPETLVDKRVHTGDKTTAACKGSARLALTNFWGQGGWRGFLATYLSPPCPKLLVLAAGGNLVFTSFFLSNVTFLSPNILHGNVLSALRRISQR